MSFQLPYAKSVEEFSRWSRLMIERLNNFFAIHAEVSHPLTLTISGGIIATTISDPLITSTSVILVMPLDSNAKGKGWYVNPSETMNGSLFILHHDTISLTAQFKYLIAT